MVRYINTLKKIKEDEDVYVVEDENGNKVNRTETNNNIGQTLLEKRQKEREEEEERKRAEQEAKAVSNETNIKTVSNSNTSSNDFLSNHSIEDAETLVKDYNKLSPTEKAKLAKEINEESTIKKMARNNAQMDDNALYSKETIEEKNGELADIKYLEDELNPNKIIKHSEVFKDGYQFGDVTKSVGSTVGDIGLNVAQGFAGVGENIADFLAAGIAEIAEVTGHKTYAERVRRNIASQETNIFTNALQKGKDKLDANSWSGNKSDEMFQGVGQTGSYAALNAIPGAGSALSTGAMFTSAAGGELSELYGSEDYQKGDLRKGKIWAKAIGSGAIEAAAERALGYFGSSGGIDKTVANYLSDMASTSIGKILARQGVNAASEGVEEVISYAGNYLLDTVIDWVDKKTGGTGEALREPWNWQDLWEQAFTAMGSAAIMGGFDTAVTAKSVNGTSISDTFNKTAQKMDLNAQMEALDTQEQKLQDKLGKNISEQEINNTFNSLQDIQNQKTNVQTQLETLPVVNKKNEKTNLDNVEQNNVKVLQTVDNNTLATANENTVNNQNSNSSELNEMLNNKDLPMQYYQYEKSDNVKVNTLKESASKYFNNSEQTKNYISMLEKITTDKNVEIKFDSNLKTADGKIANGSYSNGVITINPNSTRAGEFIAIHELTHAIGTNEMVKIIDNFKDSNIEFSNEMKALLNNYSSTEINEEALADVSAQLFGTQEFINNLSQSNPNIFQKIYREIKYLWHQFRGYKNQNQFVEDLYYKWTKAYNSNKLNTNSSFSIQTSSDGSKYVQVDTDQNIFEGKSVKEQTKIAQEYILNNFREKGLLKDENTIKVTRKTANEYTHPKNGLDNTTYSSKMKASTELDNLLEISKFIKSEADDGRHVFAKNGWDYYETVFKVGDKTYSGWLNIANGENGKLLYDITNIKERASNYSVKTVSVANSSINNSIAPSNNDVNTTTKYSVQESENNSGSFNLSKQDNKGRTLSQEQQEYFKDSKVRDENGNLKTVYHTTTKAGEQFNIFDPRGTDFYRFGDQIVNYYTDSKVMSGSYADGKYQMADTNTKTYNNNIAKRQYEGYVNLINPYILDAKNANWNQIGEGLTEYGQKLWEEIDTLEKNDLYYELKRLYDKVNFDSKNASERFREIQKNAKDGQYEILGEYARFGNIDNIFDNGLLNDRGKEQVKKHLNDKINGRTLKEIGLDLYNNKYDTLWENRINEFKNKNPIIKDFSLEDLDLIAENYSGGKSYIEYRYLNKKTTNDVVNKVIEMNKEGSNYDGVIIKNVIDYGGGNTETREPANLYVTFNSNQFKNIDNTNPTDNPDIRYSTQNNNSWHDYLEKTFPNKGTRTNLQDILAQKADSEGSYTKTIEENSQNNNNNTKTNTLKTGKWTEEKIAEGKRRKHYESILKSNYTTDEAKAIAKELMGTDTYVPESNKKQLEVADERISSSGADSELNSLLARATTGGTIKSDDIAVGERLIQYYSKIGDKIKLQESIQATAMAGTTAGQTVQAMSLLNHQTPEGQAVWLQRSVDKMNKDLKRTRGEKAEQFNLTAEMLEKVANSENAKALEENLNEVYKELGQQVTKTTAQKIDAWRYFSMLSSPKTHIRNITGNTAMAGVQSIKNKVAGTIEGVVSKFNSDMERTHTLAVASKEVKSFAKADIENVADRLGLNENKYNPKTRLENSMRTFKTDTMEKTVGKAFEFNNNLLEAEDGWGLKAGYVKALSEYMTANNLTPDNITDKQLGKARNYAVEQAKEATFHQDSQLASLLNQLSNKNKFSKFVLDSTLPFKKTPINVAKAGIEYSPVGLVKSAVYDTVKLRKGDITVNTYIDNISKGLTGTGIALVGYVLASCGVLKASGSDDEDREGFEESRGSQNYSITIGDNTYSLDWLAPSGIPLFIGAECYELMQASDEKKISSSDDDKIYNQAIESATNILDSFANAMNPMTEMSMLSGLTSALKSYDQGSSQMLASLGTNAAKSYVNQFVPTALGQIAKTTDKYERSTTSTKTGVLPKAIDSTKNQIMSKIPGLRELLPVKTDTWGNKVEQSGNVLQRALENSVLPWTRKELNSTYVDKELLTVYENTGESSVFPDSINKNITINKQKYTMTSDEYAKYKQKYGKTSYNLLNSLIKSSSYKKMSDSEKQYAIEKVYSYATEQIKVDYAKQNKLDYEQSTLSQVVNAIEKENGNSSNYFEYLAKTQDLTKDSEKIKVLANSNYSNNTKTAIYENSLGKEDSKYDILKASNISITQYLQYKSQDFSSDKKDDGTLNGATVSGSKKKKVWNYINNMNITYTQKVLLYGMEYSTTDSEKNIILNYINNLNLTKSEKLEALQQFKGFTVYKDGTVKY